VRLPRDILNPGLYTKPNFYLCETNKEKICKLETSNTKGSFKFNSLSELSFDVSRVYNDLITGKTNVNPFFDKIEALRLIYVENIGYFELKGPELFSDGIEEKKSCTAYSLEYTLSQKYLKNFYVNMGTVESIEVINASSEKNIIPVILYNPSNPKLSLLHLVLEEVYGWSIGYVDPTLQTLSRQFEIDRESVYDFLMNEVCEKFNCYIVFDTINNTINIYAESLTAKFIGDGQTNTFIISPPFARIGTVSIDGYKTTRWTYNSSTGTIMLEDAPNDGAHIEVVDGALTEWETDVFISFDNLAQEVNVSYDSDTIKTRLTVTYGDDYDIREVNLGLPYLTDISYYYTVDWMGQDLYNAYTKYMQKSNKSQLEYSKNSQEILKWNDCIAYEENRLSLEYSLAISVNGSTVGTYYIRQQNLDGSYYYSEVSLPSEYISGIDYYSNITTNVNEEKVSDLYSVLKNYFYAYFNGKAEDMANALNELHAMQDFNFMEQYTLTYLHDSLKSAKSIAEMDVAISNFLNEMWTDLGRTPLKELYLQPYKTIQEQNIKAGWSNQDNTNYGNYYPVTLFIASIEYAISERDKTINEYKDKQKVFQKANATISDSLLMRNNFTDDQLIRLSAFLREDELHIDDIVETELDDVSSSFKIKEDAMDSGRIELQKISQPQLQFSMTMANIYALPEFDPIINQFQLGKVIRVYIRPDYQKQSRLLQVDINFDDFSDFSCEFGDLTSLRTQSDIHADLLSNAITAGKSVATNSSYWTRGSDQATALDLKIQQGLLDAVTQIKSIDGSQGVSIDKYGIHLRNINPDGSIDQEEGWLVNNQFLYTDDGFKSTKAVFGKYEFDGQRYYGVIAEALVGKLLIGSKIKLENASGTMLFDDNGLSVTNEINSFVVNPNDNKLLKISNNTEDILYVDDKGNLNITGTINATSGTIGKCAINEDGKLIVPAANIDGELIANSVVVKNGDDDVLFNAANGEVKIAGFNVDKNSLYSGTKGTDNYIGLLGEHPNEDFIIGNVTSQNWRIIAGQNFGVTSDGILSATQAFISGTIHATDGEIGGCKIVDGLLEIENANITNTLIGKDISGGSLLIGNKDTENSAYAEITSDGILNCVGANITGTINATDGTFTGSVTGSTINGGSITIGDNFSVSNEGVLNCNSAKISGVLTAGIGSSIGGFKTDSNSLYKGTWTSTKTPTVFMCTGSTGNLTLAGRTGTGWCFGAGANFGVTIDGDLYAQSGKIGNWNIGNNGLTGSNNKTYIYKDGTFCFNPNSNYYCGFMDEGDATGNTGQYNFVIGGNAKLKIGSVSLSAAQLQSLLALI
jgi:hypothetical protein